MAKKLMGISARAIARERGLSHVSVLEAAKSGRIPRFPDGSFDRDAVDRAWVENTDTTKARNSITGNPRGKAKEAPDLVRGIARSNAMKAYYAALAAKADHEERMGSLVKREAVERVAFNMYRMVRDRFLAMPDRVGPMIAGIDNIPLAIKTMRDEVMTILDELGNGTFTS